MISQNAHSPGGRIDPSSAVSALEVLEEDMGLGNEDALSWMDCKMKDVIPF